ncbi:protein FAM227A-like [Acipenser oxyrinchus oxyrinchus]|uniref:Protein FAM227A-like n=1 Tax=Acipenser oxyrinchus oxyrinchus TaxID=40147 RepID=A0AAD8DG23_ACIOX|nr:protein FAM227A-like [Acipenser oxyrinchus oxyrinchus]
MGIRALHLNSNVPPKRTKNPTEMADINRICSPMAVFEEDLREDPATVEKKRAGQQEVVSSPAPCLMGSIDKVNEKIAHLHLQLLRCSSQPSPLVIPDTDEKSKKQISLRSKWEATKEDRPRTLQNKVRDEKELNKFTRRYQEHSTHTLGLENQSQTSLRTLKRTKEKPKLVELQQYPGFTIGAPTALPNGTSLDDVVKHVIQAQEKIGKKPKYQAEFRRLLSSSVTRTILLDTFWWFFLQNYQSEPHTQEKLFFRISESYVRLLTQSPSSPYGDLFLKEFPRTLSQAVYSCFCCSFPQSWHQFYCQSFLSQLCDTAFQWTGGIRPSPEVHSRWNFLALEPEGVRKEEIFSGNDKRNKGAGSPMSFLSSTLSGSVLPSCGRLAHQQSSPLARLRSKSSQHCARISSQVSMNSASLAQGTLRTPSCVPMTADTNRKAGGGLKASQNEGMHHKPKRESLPAGPGPEFMKSVFNLWGYSPLVQCYFRNQKTDIRAGMDILVRRTEILNLPPYPFFALLPVFTDSTTYWEIVIQNHHRRRTQGEAFRAQHSQRLRELAALHRKHLAERDQFSKKVKKLLSQKYEIKRLSELLYPDHKWEIEWEIESPEELALAFEEALQAQD